MQMIIANSDSMACQLYMYLNSIECSVNMFTEHSMLNCCYEQNVIQNLQMYFL